jgi:hypothetical protein
VEGERTVRTSAKGRDLASGGVKEETSGWRGPLKDCRLSVASLDDDRERMQRRERSPSAKKLEAGSWELGCEGGWRS